MPCINATATPLLWCVLLLIMMVMMILSLLGISADAESEHNGLVILALLRAMQAHAHNTRIHRMACKLLRRMTESSESISKEVITTLENNAGVATVLILNMMKEHQHEAQAQEVGCQALAIIMRSRGCFLQ